MTLASHQSKKPTPHETGKISNGARATPKPVKTFKNEDNKMKLNELHQMTALEYRLLKFFEDVGSLVEYDNNDHPDVIWNQIKRKVDELSDELKGK